MSLDAFAFSLVATLMATVQYFALWQDPAIGLRMTMETDTSVYPPATIATDCTGWRASSGCARRTGLSSQRTAQNAASWSTGLPDT